MPSGALTSGMREVETEEVGPDRLERYERA
jgi:hypothetical protein